MTKADEVMETLLGRVAICVCGLTLMSADRNDAECDCGRKWRKDMPPSESWCIFRMLNKHGSRTGTMRRTASARRRD